MRLRDVAHGEVKHMLYAIISQHIFLYLHEAAALMALFAAPDEGLIRADDHRRIIAYDFAVHIECKDAVATGIRSKVNGVGARCGDVFTAVRLRERSETNTLRPCIGLIDCQLQNDQRINLLRAAHKDSVHVSAADRIVLIAPMIRRTFAC